MNLIGDLTTITTMPDNGNATALSTSQGIVWTVINGISYAFVAGQGDNGIQVLRINADNSFTPVFQIVDSPALSISGVNSLEIVTVAGSRYLVATSVNENSISTFEINEENTGNDGHLSVIDAVVDGNVDGPNLQGPFEMESLTVGGNSFAVVAGYYDDSLSVYQIGVGGGLTLRDTVVDSDDVALNLDNAWTMTSGTVGGNTFVYVGTYSTDNGISAFQLSSAGVLTNVFNIDTPSASYRAMAMATTPGGTFLVAFDANGYNLITYSVSNTGALTQVSVFDAYINGAQGEYYDFRDFEVFQIDGATFIIGASNADDALVVYSLNDAGVVEFVTALETTALDRVSNLQMFTQAGRQYILSTTDGGIVQLTEIGAAADALIGTADADRLIGRENDDDLIGLGGNDSIYSGRGDDVLSGRMGDDRLVAGSGDDVLVGGNGNDTLEGGIGADVLVGNLGFDSVSYGTAAGAVNVSLLTGIGTGSDAEGDVFRGFENLIGSALNDTLSGNASANRLTGNSGDDRIDGLGGIDNMFGGNGNDSLYGGDQGDRMSGEIGSDRMFGGTGNDTMFGGTGSDSLVGDDGDDSMLGDDGADTLTGGAGNDSMGGGTGADVFVFGLAFGDDQIEGFSLAEDRIDLSGISTMNSLADFNAAAITFAGSTLFSAPDGSTFIIQGVTEAQLTASNFLF